MHYNTLMNNDVKTYNHAQEGHWQEICETLAKEIQQGLPDATNKVWHGAPVWFIDGNPIAGYWVRKDSVQLLFWSGQSFDEPGLKPEGSFKAAEVRYISVEQINSSDIQRWLKKSIAIQWDYKNIVKRKGHLERLK